MHNCPTNQGRALGREIYLMPVYIVFKCDLIICKNCMNAYYVRQLINVVGDLSVVLVRCGV